MHSPNPIKNENDMKHRICCIVSNGSRVPCDHGCRFWAELAPVSDWKHHKTFNETDLRRLACLYPSLEFLKSLRCPGLDQDKMKSKSSQVTN